MPSFPTFCIQININLKVSCKIKKVGVKFQKFEMWDEIS